MKIHGDLGHIWRKVMQQYACDLTKLCHYCNCKIWDSHIGLMKI